jgi:hypothetical protein
MKSLLAAFVTLSLAAGTAYAECSYPKAPDKIPDGNTATLEEMIAAQAAVKNYDKEINAYTDCIKLEYDSDMAKDGATYSDAKKKALEKRQIQKTNAAVDEDQQVAARFNEQLKAYKAKAAAKKS